MSRNYKFYNPTMLLMPVLLKCHTHIFIVVLDIILILKVSKSDHEWNEKKWSALATFVNFISMSLEVPEAIPASTMFCFPLLAPCII